MENKEIDHEGTDEIVCPYCGYEFSDSWEYYDEEDPMTCYGCSKEFYLQIHREISYDTYRKSSDCEHENAWEHNGYKHCDDCGKPL